MFGRYILLCVSLTQAKQLNIKIMTYKEFYTLATQGIDYKTISREDMQFAFIMFYQQFGESPKKAVESVQLLNTFN